MKPIITAVLFVIFSISLASCQSTSELESRLDKLTSEYSELACLNKNYSSYYSNTPCWASEISLKHTINNTKLNNEDKEVVLDMLALERNLIDAKINIIRSYGTDSISNVLGSRTKGKEAADLVINLLEKHKEDSLSNLLSLYQQEISWGVFNKNLQEYAAVYESTLNEGLANIAGRNNASPQTPVASTPARKYTSTVPEYNLPVESAYTTQSSPPEQPDYFRGARESLRRQSADLLSEESLTPVTDKYRERAMIQRDEERAARDACRQRVFQPIGGC